MNEAAREGEQERQRYALRTALATRFGYFARDERLQPLVDLLHERLNPGESFTASLERMRKLPLDAPLVQAMIARTVPALSEGYQGAAALNGLREHVLPSILDRCRASRTLRVWSAGTGTGAELYELSMLLGTMLSDVAQWHITLIGTDIDRAGLQRARDAVVRSESLVGLTPLERIQQFDVVGEGLARPKPRYRRHASFELHNLANPAAAPPAPGTFDLVLCRNVASHFGKEARATLASHLGRSLAEHGVWVASSADPVPVAGFTTRALGGLYVHVPHPSPPERRRTPAPLRSAATRPQGSRPERPAPPSATALEPMGTPLPADLRRALGEAQALADAGDLGEAAARLARLDGRAWTAPDAHLLAAMVYDGMGRTEDAKTALQRAAALDPRSADTQLRLGLMLARTGDRDAAIEALRAALDEAKEGTSKQALAVRRVAKAQLARLLQPG